MKGTSPSRVIRAVAGYGIQVPRWGVRTLINSLVSWKGKFTTAIVSVGIDLAKNVFAVHGVDATGKPALVRPSVPRTRLLELIASLPPCLIGMEACSGAHHWAREFAKFGHTVRLMAPKFVISYRLSGKRGKNDAADAAAICEAVTLPNMRFVPLKSIEQQGQLLDRYCLLGRGSPCSWRCPARSKRREAATCCCVSATSNLLNRSVTEGPQNCIDARLIASPLCLEPFEHILIHAQRNGCFGR